MGIKKKHVPGCSCCGDCFTYQDDFGGGGLPPWVEESGTWTESGGGVTTTDNYAQLIYDDPVEPFTDLFSENTGIGSSLGISRKHRLIFSWEDVNNYWYVEGTCTGSGGSYTLTLELGYYDAGTNFVVATDSDVHTNAFGGSYSLIACYRDGYVRGIIQFAGVTTISYVESVQTLPAGKYGVGTGDLSGGWTVGIGGWQLFVNTTGTYDENCGQCEV